MALIDVKEVQNILCIAESTAYSVIKKLNQELESQGFLTLRGKVEKNYLLNRYGITTDRESRTS